MTAPLFGALDQLIRGTTEGGPKAKCRGYMKSSTAIARFRCTPQHAVADETDAPYCGAVVEAASEFGVPFVASLSTVRPSNFEAIFTGGGAATGKAAVG
jgi:hypothetical protein